MKVTKDEIAMRNFKETLTFSDNRYQVTWPWKDDTTHLPDNINLALGRLRSTWTRIRNKPDILQMYTIIIEDQLSRGIFESVDRYKADGLVHYIPHHAVITPQKSTTKLRIVYNASA